MKRRKEIDEIDMGKIVMMMLVGNQSHQRRACFDMIKDENEMVGC